MYSQVEMNAFENFCSNLLNACKIFQKDKELVNENDAYRALNLSKNMPLNKAGDVLLFCTSINLMNTYVKQSGCRRFGYFFKGFVPRLIQHLQEKPIEGVQYGVKIDKKRPVIIVEVCGLQFSFRNIKGSKSWRKKTNKISFDGIRKQQCALTLFNRAQGNILQRT